MTTEHTTTSATQMSRRGIITGGAGAAAALGLGSVIGASPARAAEPNPLSGELLTQIRKGRRYRLRELGIAIGTIPTGRFNAITDVPGVKVGYKTLIFDTPGIARTGVTAIIPRADIFDNYCYAAVYSHNGNGEMTGSHWVTESGWLTTNIAITNTAQVGIVRDTMVKMQAEVNPDLTWSLPVVAETWDGRFNDINKFWVKEQDVRDAFEAAKGGTPAEGNVGGGTGMSFMGWKGGSGTSSRIVNHLGKDYTVGVFVQSNFGSKDDLMVKGAPVGKDLPLPGTHDVANAPTKSCIIIVATDAPLLADQCHRLATRAGIGLADVGGVASNGDGDIYFAFSTGNRIPQGGTPTVYRPQSISNNDMTPFFRATIDATQEALINSATKAETLVGLNGRVKYALPLDLLVRSVAYHRV